MERNHDAEIRYLGCNRERRIFVARRLAELPIEPEEPAEEFESRVNGRARPRHAFEKVQNAAMERPKRWRRTEDGFPSPVQSRFRDLTRELDSNNLINGVAVVVDLSSVQDWNNAGSAPRHRAMLAAQTREGKHRCLLCICDERGADRAPCASPSFAPLVNPMPTLPMSSTKGKSYVAGK